jgi:hypothetical protein
MTPKKMQQSASCASGEYQIENCPQAECFRCGKQGHMQRNCPDRHRCYRCKQEGHFAKDCKQPCKKCQATDHQERDCHHRQVGWAVRPKANPTLEAANRPEVQETQVASAWDVAGPNEGWEEPRKRRMEIDEDWQQRKHRFMEELDQEKQGN